MRDRSITVVAPARICLAGEGCDWMLARAANWAFPEVRTTAEVEIRDAANDDIVVEYAELGKVENLQTLSGQGTSDRRYTYAAACLQALRRAGADPRGILVRVSSTVPMCGGLSSSAALCVALVASMASASGLDLDAHAVAELAYEAEQLMEIPCGRMDQYSILHSEPMIFDAAANPPRITSLMVEDDVVVVVGFSEKGRSSFAEQYPLVRRRWLDGEHEVMEYIKKTAAICDSLLDASVNRCLDAGVLGECVQRAHSSIVEHLGIMNPEIDAWVTAALRAGALGAKSCGARRRGGAMLAICVPGTAEGVARALMDRNASVIVSNPTQKHTLASNITIWK